MPYGDGSGPRGMGPMTGRGAGFCTGNNAPGFMNRQFGGGGFGNRGGGFGNHGGGFGNRGGGFGGNFGGGRGNRNRYYDTGMTRSQMIAQEQWQQPEMELDALKAQADSMEAGLKKIRRQIEKLEKQKEA